MTFLSLLLLGFTLWIVAGFAQLVRGLTASSAVRWALAAVVLMFIETGLSLSSAVPAGISSALHYLSATLLLAPLIDLLGARNPGHRAWPWFVVVPMIVILQWPVLSHVFSESPTIPVEVPLPTLAGFLLVLVMGAGNYFGTAQTSACLLGAAAVILSVLPTSEWVAWPGTGWRLASSVCLTIAALLIEGRLRENTGTRGHEAMWLDFRDTYGLVWSRRVMDRINQFAEREDWDVVMTLNGFEPSISTANEEGLERPEEVLRWVLRRFADENWLAGYLESSDCPQISNDDPEAARP